VRRNGARQTAYFEFTNFVGCIEAEWPRGQGTGFRCLDTGFAGSNPSLDTDVYPRLMLELSCVVTCPVTALQNVKKKILKIPERPKLLHLYVTRISVHNDKCCTQYCIRFVSVVNKPQDNLDMRN
jgi:hypothetical protein